jgi:hypothetical protein
MSQDPRLPDGWSQDKIDAALEWQSEQRQRAEDIKRRMDDEDYDPTPEEDRHLERWGASNPRGIGR